MSTWTALIIMLGYRCKCGFDLHWFCHDLSKCRDHIWHMNVKLTLCAWCTIIWCMQPSLASIVLPVALVLCWIEPRSWYVKMNAHNMQESIRVSLKKLNLYIHPGINMGTQWWQALKIQKFAWTRAYQIIHSKVPFVAPIMCCYVSSSFSFQRIAPWEMC